MYGRLKKSPCTAVDMSCPQHGPLLPHAVSQCCVVLYDITYDVTLHVNFLRYNVHYHCHCCFAISCRCAFLYCHWYLMFWPHAGRYAFLQIAAALHVYTESPYIPIPLSSFQKTLVHYGDEFKIASSCTAKH